MHISVSVQHENLCSKKRWFFRLVMSLRHKKRVLSPHEELNLRPMHSVLHRSAESKGGVIWRK